MTNTYNTLNPLGSTSAKDLSDNASNFDEGMNSLSPSFYDRFKRRRETWAGMEKMVSDFLEAMGFEATHLQYVDGAPLTVLRPTQLIDRAGSVYKVKQPASFPVVLSGTWAADQNLLLDIGDSSLRMALTADTGSSLVGFKGPGAGEVSLTASDFFKDSVSVRRFGAVCDGVADDTLAVQRAIDYCATFSNWPALEIPGRCKITASLVIDRMVDSTTSEFRIFGTGSAGGFHATTSIEMFTSSFSVTTTPLSEFITFINVCFTCDDFNTAPRVLSKKFLRMKFLNCYFKNVRLLSSDTYAQSFFFSNCNIRSWVSYWMVATHAFDTDFDGCISEFSNGYLCRFINGCYSVRFRGGVHEGSEGGLIETGNAYTLLISGYYFENNNQPSLNFNGGTGNKSITVESCWFGSTPANIANANFYEIVWGNTEGAVSIGNNHYNGRLHDNTGLPATSTAAGMDSLGDTAALSIYRQPKNVNQGAGSWQAVTTLGTGTINFAQYRRTKSVVTIDFSVTFSGVSGSAAAIAGLPFASTQGIFGGIVTVSDQTGEIYLIGGASAPNGTTATSFAICKNRQGTPYTYTELNGKQVIGQLQINI